MTQSTEQPQVPDVTTVSSRPALTVDWPRYAALLADMDIEESQKQEFLETLWTIIVAFVDLGFGIHPLQQACEQNLDQAGQSLIAVGDMIDSAPAIDTLNQEATASTNEARGPRDA